MGDFNRLEVLTYEIMYANRESSHRYYMREMTGGI